ncbi:hypothetical protein BASA81_004847 [Batrachochytrium salamandrivorans]|nr:hypothetical protein BASA81_004847 [Batrachochytrium salamandrivorans]
MISCKAVAPKLFQRNDLYEISHFDNYCTVFKTSTELTQLHQALCSSTTKLQVPSTSRCQPNPMKLGGGEEYLAQTALAYEYLLNWTEKHDHARLRDFLGLPAFPLPSNRDLGLVEAPTREATSVEAGFVLLCLVCIGLTANDSSKDDGHAPQALQVFATPTTTAPEYAWTVIALQLACVAVAQWDVYKRGLPANSNGNESNLVVYVDEEDRNAVVDFAVGETTFVPMDVIKCGELLVEEEEEEETVVLKCGELFVEMDEPAMPQEVDSFVLRSGELSVEYETEDDNESCSSVWEALGEEDFLDDGEDSTDLSSGGEEGEESTTYRPRTNWSNTVKQDLAQFHNGEGDYYYYDNYGSGGKNEGDQGSWFGSQDVATKVAVGTAGVLVVAGLAMRFKRWLA